jgi:hypothetical protein
VPDTIASRKSELSRFPSAEDLWTRYQDGNRQANVTNAEIVNKIEAVTLATQEHAQKTARLAQNAQAGGNRKRLVLAAVVHNDRTRDYWDYTFRLSAAQLAFVGGSVRKSGMIFLPSVYAFANFVDGTPARFRSHVMPQAPDLLHVRLDNIDTSNKVKAGEYQIRVVVLAL